VQVVLGDRAQRVGAAEQGLLGRLRFAARVGFGDEQFRDGLGGAGGAVASGRWQVASYTPPGRGRSGAGAATRGTRRDPRRELPHWAQLRCWGGPADAGDRPGPGASAEAGVTGSVFRLLGLIAVAGAMAAGKVRSVKSPFAVYGPVAAVA